MTGCKMKHGFKHIAALLVFLSGFSVVYGQVTIKASVDKDRILIGEKILLTVEAYFPLGQPVTWFSADSIPHFEFIDKYGTDTADGIDGKKISQLFSITSFDSGRWEIPSFEIAVAGQSYRSDSISIDVSFVSFDPSADYRDIKEIVSIVNPSAGYIPWVMGSVTLTAILLLIYLLRKRKATSTAPRKEHSRHSPYEEAMMALDELKSKASTGISDKELYSVMNNILRLFMLRKHSLSTLERTNSELVAQLSRMALSREAHTALAQTLNMIDFVKFAKYQPGEEDKKQDLTVMRASIEILDKILVDSAV